MLPCAAKRAAEAEIAADQAAFLPPKPEARQNAPENTCKREQASASTLACIGAMQLYESNSTHIFV